MAPRMPGVSHSVRFMGKTLRARVLRGSPEVGGSCVEISYEGATVLDRRRFSTVGREFRPAACDRDRGAGAFAAGGVGESWASGSLGVGPEVAVDDTGVDRAWCGRRSPCRRVLGPGIDLREAGHSAIASPFAIGPFTVTPYLADHSGFDAYSLLIEAGGRRLFYTGDFRGHGRKHCLQRLLADPPRDVHALVMEGTSIRPE